MTDKTNIFSIDSNESPLQVIRQTMSVAVDKNGTPSVTFATNRGKGSGSQTIPVADYEEVVNTLQEYADAGIAGREDKVLSPAETVRSTICYEDGMISFRVRSGKGSKPAKIPVDQFNQVCSLLSDTVSAVEDAGSKLNEPESAAPSEDHSNLGE